MVRAFRKHKPIKMSKPTYKLRPTIPLPLLLTPLKEQTEKVKTRKERREELSSLDCSWAKTEFRAKLLTMK